MPSSSQINKWRNQVAEHTAHIVELKADLAAGQDAATSKHLMQVIEHAEGLVTKYKGMIAAGEKLLAHRT